MSPHVATFREALTMLGWMIGWDSPWIPVGVAESGATEDFWHRCDVPGARERLIWLVEHLEITRDATVTLGCPERRRGAGAAAVTFLVVRLQGTEQVQRAGRLPCLPSMALKEGSSSRRTLLWWLRRPVGYFDACDLNRKLAYACGATQKHGVLEHVRLPVPGTCIRTGARPAPVVTTRLDAGAFEPDQVVWRLKEPPDPSAWLESKVNGGWR